MTAVDDAACGARLLREHLAEAEAERDQLRAREAAIRAFHDQWGHTDVEDLDQLELWEGLDRLLRGGSR